MSFPVTATKYGLQMESFIAVPDVTSGNAVSNTIMLCLKPLSHIRTGSHQASQICATAYHNHSTNTIIACTCDSRTKTCCPSFHTCSHTKGHPSAYTHLYTKCSTCATTKVRPCPHRTKTHDYRDVTEQVTAPGYIHNTSRCSHKSGSTVCNTVKKSFI